MKLFKDIVKYIYWYFVTPKIENVQKISIRDYVEWKLQGKFKFENYWIRTEPGFSLNCFTVYHFTGCCACFGITILNFNFEWVKA